MDTMEKSIYDLRVENTAVREELAAARTEIAKKDEAIAKLTEQVNRLDQAARSSTVRIYGLPIDNNTPVSSIASIVLKEVIIPVLNQAKEVGDIPPANPPQPFPIDYAFAIPSKNGKPCPVVVKLASNSIRNLIFKHKKTALPVYRDLPSNKVKGKYAIYEDLSPANHAHLRALSADHRVTSIWTFNGQIRLRIRDGETIFRVKSLADTVDSLSKTPHPMSP
jgi:hypothetical protein